MCVGLSNIYRDADAVRDVSPVRGTTILPGTLCCYEPPFDGVYEALLHGAGAAFSRRGPVEVSTAFRQAAVEEDKLLTL